MHDIEWYCVTLHGTKGYCMVLQGTAWYCMILNDSAWYSMILHGIAWHCMVQNGIAWCYMEKHGIAWYWVILHGIAWYCMVLHGIAWYYKVLHDTEWWYSMVLHGIAWYYKWYCKASTHRASWESDAHGWSLKTSTSLSQFFGIFALFRVRSQKCIIVVYRAKKIHRVEWFENSLWDFFTLTTLYSLVRMMTKFLWRFWKNFDLRFGVGDNLAVGDCLLGEQLWALGGSESRPCLSLLSAIIWIIFDLV